MLTRVDIARLGVLAICGAIGTSALLRGNHFKSADAADVRPSRIVTDWKDYASGTSDGPDTARVRIVVFSDFQCPFCGTAAMRLDSIRAEYPNDVRVFFRHFPVAARAYSRSAAVASECAGEQGRFWLFHDVLFQQQQEIGNKRMQEFARLADVPNDAAFAECIQAGRVEARIDRDLSAGRRIGIRGTPTMLINQRLVEGAVPMEVLRRLIEDAYADAISGQTN